MPHLYSRISGSHFGKQGQIPINYINFFKSLTRKCILIPVV
jgi:hypothetical protein